MFKSENTKSIENREDKNNNCNGSTNNISKKVEIPFCSHKFESKPPAPPTEDRAGVSHSPSPSLPSSRLELSPEEQKAAEDILKELVEIRREGKQKSDPVLDAIIRLVNIKVCRFNRITCFSVIKLSSESLSLPSPVTSGATAGIHFKELFNFEVNFCESK